MSPNEPIQGDIVNFSVIGTPDETVLANVTFKHMLEVFDGNYLWKMQEVDIPILPNSFSVRAKRVDLLRVSIKIFGIPVTKSSTGTNNIAEVIQNNVPIGVYEVEISGIAFGNTGIVPISVSAITEFKLDENGAYNYSYDTKNLPPGEFSINVGDLYKTVNLKPDNEGSTENVAPILVLDIPAFAYVEELIRLSGSRSYDPDGEIVDFIWEVNGTKYYGDEISFTRKLPGKYNLSITIMDNEGLCIGEQYFIYILEDEDIEEPKISIDFNSTNDSVFVNEVYNFSLCLRNNGNVNLSDVSIFFIVNSKIIDESIVSWIESGETKLMYFEWIPEEIGSYEIRLEVESGQILSDSNVFSSQIVNVSKRINYLYLVFIGIFIIIFILMIKKY